MNLKFYLFAFVMTIASPAWSGWTFVAKSVEGDSFFIDFENLRKEGNIRKVWQKVELNKENKFKWLSLRYRNEYDCKNETISILSLTAFSEKNLDGEKLWNGNKISEKEDIAPDSVDWSILKKVCSK